MVAGIRAFDLLDYSLHMLPRMHIHQVVHSLLSQCASGGGGSTAAGAAALIKQSHYVAYSPAGVHGGQRQQQNHTRPDGGADLV